MPPPNPKAQLWNAAIAAMRAGRWHEAVQHLLRLQAQTPNDAQVLFHIGYALHAQGRETDAITWMRRAVAADPAQVTALANLGTLLLRCGQEREGLHHVQQAVRRKPDDPALLRSLAAAWLAVANAPRALEVAERALALVPGDPALLSIKLAALEITGGVEQARPVAAALATGTDREVVGDALAWLLDDSARSGDWDGLERQRARLLALHAGGPLQMNASRLMFVCDDPALLAGDAHLVGGAVAYGARPPCPPPRPDGRITIAYLSSDLRSHPVGQMLLTVLRAHDRTRVRVVLGGILPPDGTPVAQALLAAADAFVDLSQADSQDIRRVLQEQGVDALIDLNGTTQGGRIDLLRQRPCAVQLLWLGCPTSTGYAHYDGFLVDAQVAPPGYERWCSEPLVRLPCCYHPIGTGLVDEPSALSRADLGWPADTVMIGLVQDARRILPSFVREVATRLARNPAAHLVLRVREAARPAVLATLAACGLPAERVHVPGRFDRRADYLRMVALLDVFLDSQPYGGHSTTGEALTLGVPVLTRAGNCIHARVGSSMLHELGLADLVAGDQEDYLGRLERLVAEPALRTEWRARIAAAVAPADARHRRLAAALEDACVAAVAAARAR